MEPTTYLGGGEPSDLGLCVVHSAIKVAQELVTEQLVVYNVPLTTSIVEGRVVAGAGEIKPLGMTKLVSNKGQVTLTSKTVGHQADHLMQGQTTVNDRRQFCQDAHMCVHLLVHEPERNSLVTDQSLVVRLTVSNRGFLRTRSTENISSINKSEFRGSAGCTVESFVPHHVSPVGQSEDNVAKIPLIIRLFLEQLDPHVGDSH